MRKSGASPAKRGVAQLMGEKRATCFFLSQTRPRSLIIINLNHLKTRTAVKSILNHPPTRLLITAKIQ